MPYLLNGFGGTFHNPLLDYLLPLLLYVKMVAILDAALIFFIGDRGWLGLRDRERSVKVLRRKV